MTKARTLADFTSDGSLLADGQITVSEVVGAAPLASPTFSGTVTSTGNIVLGDNNKAIFGEELEIYSDATHARIREYGSGQLKIQGDNMQLLTSDGASTYLEGNASTGAVTLYHASNAPRIATTSAGVDVTGTVTADKLNVTHAGGGDFMGVFQNTTSATPYGVHIKDAASGANGYPLFQVTNSAGSSAYLLVHSGTGNVGIGTNSPAANHKLNIDQAGYVQALLSTSGTARLSLYGDAAVSAVDAKANPLALYAGSAERMRIDASGRVTKPYQPAFGVLNNTAGQNNISPGSDHTVVFGGEIFDQGNDFASNTFTAPVSGRYQFNVHIRLYQIDTAATYYQAQLATSNYNYEVGLVSPKFTSDPEYIILSGSILADMDASDTAYVRVYQHQGSAQTDLQQSTSTFSGYLVA